MENYNLIDLNKPELLDISGGRLPKWTPWGAAAWLTHEVINNWSDIKSGISDAYNDYFAAMEKNK